MDNLRWLIEYNPAADETLSAAGDTKPLTRRLRECADEIERLRNEMQSFRERVERNVIEMRIGYNATACEPCHGLGVRAYGSTATWRGSAGGMAITSDVCDRCWGSGNADRPWPSHRNLSREGGGVK